MSDGSDPYLYPGTDVLRNIPGLRSADPLSAFETLNTARRSYELLRNPPVGDFVAAHLKAVHRWLFQDVFPWAGEFRTTMPGKAERIGKVPTWFTSPHLLEQEADRIFEKVGIRLTQVRADSDGTVGRMIVFRRLPPSPCPSPDRPQKTMVCPTARQGHSLSEADSNFEKIAPRALASRSAPNRVRPFREGNGRTQRLFVDSLARQAGHALHFDVVSRERMVLASIESMAGKPAMMIRMFEEITDSQRIQPLRRAIAFLDREKFNWNDAYIATTTPGQNTPAG